MDTPIALSVRLARPADLRHLAAIENAGVSMFEEHLGDRMVPALREPAVSGGERMDRPGLLLVATAGGSSAAAGPPIGFAHLVVLDGFAHLDQVSVLPEHGRRGIGTALVRAVMEEARWAGHRRLSLTTYADVPWNAPFYRGLGFVEVDRLEPYQRWLREREAAVGLDGPGRRCVMAAALVR